MDNPGDSQLAIEDLKESKLRNNLHIVMDGIETMDFLHKKGKHTQAPRPRLILLDRNLPPKDGRDVLAEIKSDLDLKRIPFVILTISKAEEGVLKTYNLHANRFITKPLDLNQFVTAVKSIEDFWLPFAKLPAH